MTQVFAQDFKAAPYWWETAAPTNDSQELPDEVDFLVVGGGYTGLNAAITAQRAGISTTVVDAEPIGWGGSSRNGGQVTGGLKFGVDALTRSYGSERAHQILQAAHAAFPFIEDLIAREQIDCDYVRSGKFVAAWSKRHYATMEAKVDVLAKLSGHPARLVPPSQQREELASDHYCGGYVSEAGGLLHPAKYVLELKRVALQAGAKLAGGVQVTKITPRGTGFAVSAGGRTIRAASVLVATNAYSDQGSRGDALPWLTRRIVPITSYMIATEEIGEDRVKALFPTMRAVSDTRNLLNYFRASPDGKRILWGGRARLTETTVEFTAPILHRFMTDVIPSLKDVKLTHAWKGNVGFTFDFIPHLGKHDGIHYAAGCQGSGVAMMSWLGHNAALEVAGRPAGTFALADLPFPSRPGYSGRPWFLPIVGEWYRFRDFVDRRAA